MAFEVAAALGAPLDVIVVRKLGVPFQPELAMGAIGEDGVPGPGRRGRCERAGVTADELAPVEETRATGAASAGPSASGGAAPRVDLAGRIA